MSTYLLTWNPQISPWPDYQDQVAAVRQGRSVAIPWSAGGTQQIRKGDRLFMLRQGDQPRGIIGSGHAASDWYSDRRRINGRGRRRLAGLPFFNR